MVSTARAGAADEPAAAQADLLRAQVSFASGLGTDAPPLLLDAARRLEPLDPDQARETYLEALGAAMLAGPDAAPRLLEISRAARDLPPRAGEPRAVDLLLEGLALLVTDGHQAAAATLQRATDAFLGGGASFEDSLRWGWAATAPSDAMWEDRRMREVCERQIQRTREAGALALLPLSLVAFASFSARAGNFTEVASLAAEAEAIAHATGMRMAPYAALMLRAAVAGEEAELTALTRITVEGASVTGHGIAVTVTHWVAAVLHNGLGRYDEAQRAAKRATSTPGDLFSAVWSLPELVEAATRRGETQVAREALDRLAATTQGAGTDFALGVEARSRALISDGEAADALYRESIERLGRTPRGRTWLAPTSCMASGYGARAGARTRAPSCAPPTSSWPRWGWTASPSVHAASSLRRASGCAPGRSTPATISPRRRRGSPGSRATGCRIPRSGRGSSSALAPSSGISARCSRSSASPRGINYAPPCLPLAQRRPPSASGLSTASRPSSGCASSAATGVAWRSLSCERAADESRPRSAHGSDHPAEWNDHRSRGGADRKGERRRQDPGRVHPWAVASAE